MICSKTENQSNPSNTLHCWVLWICLFPQICKSRNIQNILQGHHENADYAENTSSVSIIEARQIFFHKCLALPMLQRYWQQSTRIFTILTWAGTLKKWAAFSDLIWSKGGKLPVWISSSLLNSLVKAHKILLSKIFPIIFQLFHEVQRQRQTWKKKQETEPKYLASAEFACLFVRWRKNIDWFQTDTWGKLFLTAANLKQE